MFHNYITNENIKKTVKKTILHEFLLSKRIEKPYTHCIFKPK